MQTHPEETDMCNKLQHPRSFPIPQHFLRSFPLVAFNNQPSSLLPSSAIASSHSTNSHLLQLTTTAAAAAKNSYYYYSKLSPMNSRAPVTFRHIITSSRPRSTASERSLETFPPEKYSDLVRRRGGFISVPRKLVNGSGSQKLTKLLLNVNIERSLGPVQVVMAPENTVRDLIKAAVDIYVKDKRRPLLKDCNPDGFQLHYSEFSLESLKPDERLINLGSRNFFLCSKPSNSVSSCCLGEAKLANKFAFPFIKLMDFLLQCLLN